MASLGSLLLKRLGRRSRPKIKPRTSRPSRKVSRPTLNLPRKVESQVEEPKAITLDLVRPTGALKKSIESFLLDQRSENTRRAYSKDLKRFLKYWLERRERSGLLSLDRGHVIGYNDSILSEGL
jgi:hypothetical protein